MTRQLAAASLGVCLAATAVTVAWAAPQADTTYSGNTSQGSKASLRTNATANGIRAFRLRRELDCGEETVTGTFRTVSDDGGVIRVGPKGKFFTQAGVQPSGQIRRGVFTIRGKFGPRGGAARGTYRERVRLRNGTRCDTGEVRFRVKAQD